MGSKLDEISEQLQSLTKELAEDRAERRKGLSVTKLHIPALMWVLSVPALVTGAVAVSAFYATTRDHLRNTIVHIDPQKAERLDGVAYNRSVQESISAAVGGLEKRLTTK